MSADHLNASRAPLLAHLTELRSRLVYCLLFFVAVFGVAYYFATDIYQFLQQPLLEIFGPESGRRMIYTSLQEAFFTYLKLAFFTALFCTLPLALIQVWRFLAPGLYEHERKGLVPLFVMTPVLFVMGGALAFYVVMPLAWEFFISFETAGNPESMRVELEAKVSEYLGLVIKLILAFGLSFELPVLLLVMAKAGLVDADTLKQYRRHAIVLIFFVAAFITPPDLISQIALGTPIIILYEISIVLVSWTQRQQAARAEHPVSET